MVIQGAPEPIHQLDRNVPAELVAICEKAMQREPEDRYASAEEMAEEAREIARLGGTQCEACENALDVTNLLELIP